VRRRLGSRDAVRHFRPAAVSRRNSGGFSRDHSCAPPRLRQARSPASVSARNHPPPFYSLAVRRPSCRRPARRARPGAETGSVDIPHPLVVRETDPGSTTPPGAVPPKSRRCDGSVRCLAALPRRRLFPSLFRPATARDAAARRSCAFGICEAAARAPCSEVSTALHGFPCVAGASTTRHARSVKHAHVAVFA
jgi:hypothetical protein